MASPTPIDTVALSPTVTVTVLFATVTGLAVAALALRQRPRPGATPLAVLELAAAWWAGTYGMELAADGLSSKLFWARMQWFGSTIIPVAWLVFVLEYTGDDEHVRPLTVGALSVVPGVSILLVWTNAYHGLVRESVRVTSVEGLSVLSVTWGPWFWLVVGYTYLLAVTGVLLLIDFVVHTPTHHEGQVGTIAVAAIAPWAGNALYVAELLPGPPVDLTPIGFVVSGLAGLVALTQYDLLESSAVSHRLARGFVLERIEDGIVVLDDDGDIIDLNTRAASVICSSEALGRSADEVVPGYERVAAEMDGESASDVVAIDDGDRFFDVHVTSLTDHHDREVGRVVVLRDVTQVRRQRERLDVLNRVLRHNLRNEMNVIYGLADSIEDDRAETIKERALRVVDTGNKARLVEEMLTEGQDRTPISVAATLEERTTAVAEDYPAATIEVTERPDPGVRAGWALGPVVENLVENAAEHNTSDDPHVAVGATVDGDDVVVEIRDDGPGIPAPERSVLESGGETALDHGSGVGLWLVTWGIRQLGGTIEFDVDDGGTTATVRVPREA